MTKSVYITDKLAQVVPCPSPYYPRQVIQGQLLEAVGSPSLVLCLYRENAFFYSKWNDHGGKEKGNSWKMGKQMGHGHCGRGRVGKMGAPDLETERKAGWGGALWV